MGDCEAFFLWQHEYGSRWITYLPNEQVIINEALVKGSKSVCLPLKTKLIIYFDKMHQRNKASGRQQRIRACVHDEAFYAWLWKDDDDDWNSYTPGISFELECGLKNKKDKIQFFLENDYVVHLNEMKQQHERTGSERDVKRERVEVELNESYSKIAEQFTNAVKAKLDSVRSDSGCRSTKKIKTDPQPAATVLSYVCKGEVPVDPECKQLIESAHVYSDESGIYDVTLNQTYLQTNSNKYYRMQLLKDDLCAKYYIWYHCGRVGQNGHSNLIPFHSALRAAKKDFCNKFFDKTGNFWAERELFTKCPQKYEMLQMEYLPKEVLKTEDTMCVERSKLHPKIFAFIKRIFNIQDLVKKIVDMKFDIKKAPLGKLSKDQLLAGYATLHKIENILKNKERGSSLIEACNDFYSRIPHSFGMKTPTIISNLNLLSEKMQLLDALSDAEVTVNILNKQPQGDESIVDCLYDQLSCELNVLCEGDLMYMIIEKYLQETHGPTHSVYKMEIIDIYEYRCNDEYSRFLDSGNKYLLWHGSRTSNYVGILKSGLKVAPSDAPSTGEMFGKGLYFADASSKSANYCCPTREKNTGILLLCEVSLGNPNVLHSSNCDAEKETSALGRHSVKAIGRFQSSSKDWQTVADVTIPHGVLKEENDAADLELYYNEYVVYNPNQVKIRYLVHIKFNYC